MLNDECVLIDLMCNWNKKIKKFEKHRSESYDVNGLELKPIQIEKQKTHYGFNRSSILF